MRQLSHTQEIIQLLSRESNWFIFREVDFPCFALFLRKNYLEPSTDKLKITNRERRVLNKYERALAYYWYAFPSQFYTHPLVKDYAFFLTCLFEIRSNKDREIILEMWGKISTQESSPFSNLKYYAPGDYRSLLAPRTKTQRIRIAQQLLQILERSFSPETTNEIDYKHFLEGFHRYVFYAPKILNKNDFSLLTKIIEFQSDDQQLLGTHCKLNKNTVSNRLNWLMASHVLFHRRRILYNVFDFVPYLLLVRTKNQRPILLSDFDKLTPWILSEFIGSNKQQIHNLLIPDSVEGKELFEGFVQDTLSSVVQEVHILQRCLNHEFFIYNLNTYDLSRQQWSMHFPPSSDANANSSILWPFEKQLIDTFIPSGIQMQILNFFKVYPNANYRTACTNLRIGTSTLTQELRILRQNRIISDLFGVYPFDLPEFVSLLIQIQHKNALRDLLDQIGSKLPISQGCLVIGDHPAVYLNISLPSRHDIGYMYDELLKRNADILWFQVNEHPFASNWLFPLDFWDDSTNKWILAK